MGVEIKDGEKFFVGTAELEFANAKADNPAMINKTTKDMIMIFLVDISYTSKFGTKEFLILVVSFSNTSYSTVSFSSRCSEICSSCG